MKCLDNKINKIENNLPDDCYWIKDVCSHNKLRRLFQLRKHTTLELSYIENKGLIDSIKDSEVKLKKLFDKLLKFSYNEEFAEKQLNDIKKWYNDSYRSKKSERAKSAIINYNRHIKSLIKEIKPNPIKNKKLIRLVKKGKRHEIKYNKILNIISNNCNEELIEHLNKLLFMRNKSWKLELITDCEEQISELDKPRTQILDSLDKMIAEYNRQTKQKRSKDLIYSNVIIRGKKYYKRLNKTIIIFEKIKELKKLENEIKDLEKQDEYLHLIVKHFEKPNSELKDKINNILEEENLEKAIKGLETLRSYKGLLLKDSKKKDIRQ